MSGDLRKTPLYERHIELGAKIVPFGGYAMPVQYAGVSEEHRAVRERAGLFDVSHMGEFHISGTEGEGFVNYVVTNDVSRLETGQALYTVMCRDDGGIIDDLLVYRFERDFRLVVNAANIEKDYAWIEECRDRYGADRDVELIDESEEIALLALQGPRSEGILGELTDLDLARMGYYRFTEGAVAGVEGVVSRTGYTGEDGFEIYCSAAESVAVWDALLESGKSEGLIPAGLGARDTLRLEAGYALYGNDIDETTSPLEARLGWTVKLGKGEFVGREALLRQKEEGIRRKLSGFELLERGFPRAGYEILHGGGAVGTVRSGTVGPTVGKGIGTGYLPIELTEPDTEISIRIRERDLAARVAQMPFYTSGSLKR